MLGHESPPQPLEGRLLLARNQRSPLWRQILSLLEGEIRSGRYAPGDRLPTEGELAQWFGVNRHTVRRALAGLRERKLVRAVQGCGTFVDPGVVHYPVSRRTRFSENLNRQNRSPGGVLMGSYATEADERLSKALQLDRNKPVMALDILREGDGRPLSISTHYFPLPRFAGIAETFRKTGSVTACLAAHGVADFFRDETRVTARPPTGEEARLLGLPKSRPVLETRSINVDEHGVPVDYGETRYAADRVQLVIKTR